MNSLKRTPALCGVALLLTGCATAPTVSIEEIPLWPAKKAFVAQHEELARNHEAAGSLGLALQEWLAVSAVFPDALPPRVEIERLQQAISFRVSAHLKAAEAGLAKSDFTNARLRYLKALALQPDNREAIRALKKLEAGVSYGKLAKVPEVSSKRIAGDMPTLPVNGEARKGNDAEPEPMSSLEAALREESPAPAGSAPGVRGNLELARRRLSEEQYDAALEYLLRARRLKEASEEVLNEHITFARGELAERHYDNGVSAFRMADYGQAVTEFKKALEYNPQYKRARLYLESASELLVSIPSLE